MNGTLEHTDAGPRLRFVRLLEHPPEVVWRAITEPDELASWFPQRVSVERWQTGARLRFEHAHVAAASFDGEVLAVDPPSLLEFSWGPDVLRFELEVHGAGTRLTLLDTLEELGKAARDGAGWHVCLEQLEHRLRASSPSWSSSERWREVHPGYVERMGPAAASIDPSAGSLGE